MTTSVIEKKKALGKRECARIYKEAVEAGLKAGHEVGVPKFIVGDAIGLSNEIDYSKPTYVLDGLCGFAWVNIPNRGAFVTYLKSINVGSKNWDKGYGIWISDFGQSVDRKSAYARAFAKVLQNYGIDSRAGSRID